MPTGNYTEDESDFLDYMITKLGLSGKNAFAFRIRFMQDNVELDDKALANKNPYKDKLAEGTTQETEKTLRDCLGAICDQFSQIGCNFNDAPRGRWKIAKKWMTEELYPEWIDPPKPDTFWTKIKELPMQLNQMMLEVVYDPQNGPVRANLAIPGTQSKKPTVKLESGVKLIVNLAKGGFLTVWQKGASGQYWCVSPSVFVPQPMVENTNITLPQPNSEYPYFEIAGQTGIDEVIVMVSPKQPGFNWLPSGNCPPKKLGVHHLQELLHYTRKEHANLQLLYMDYVVAG